MIGGAICMVMTCDLMVSADNTKFMYPEAKVGVFGGLTLWLNDETFIMMKPTIVYGLFAAVLGGGLALNRPTVKALLGEALHLDDDGWRALSLRFCLFFLGMAILNEVVRRVASMDTWVLWKVPGSMAATFIFMLFQLPLIRRHMPDETIR